MSDLRAQLQTALGATYTLERELGGGGMSCVFASGAMDSRADAAAITTALNRGLSRRNY